MKQIFYHLFLWHLRFWAKYKLNQIKPQIIGVTGSVGKSSVVYSLDAVLSKHFKVKTTLHGNSETGLPLEILGLRKYLDNYSLLTWAKLFVLVPLFAFKKESYQYLIAEMGVDEPTEPKNMSYLLKIIKPNIGIFLSVAPVHTEQFGSVAAIAKEKGLLVTTLASDKTAIINTDYPEIKDLIPKIKSEIITVGQKSDFSLIDYKVDLKGTNFEFTSQGKKYSLLFPQMLFKEYGYNFLAVLACCQKVGISLATAISDLEQSFVLPPGRFSLISGVNNSLIIDSSYNSSPTALSASLNFVKDLKIKGRKIAILGDMRELGSLTEKEHTAIAPMVKKSVDMVVLVGPYMREHLYPALIKSGFPKDKIFGFLTAENVAEKLKDVIKKDDLILVKGSQNTIFLEEVVKGLMSDSKNSDKLLARQSAFWDKKRFDYFKSHPNEKYN